MIGEPAVTRIEQAHNSGQTGGGIERPGPPDLPREIDNGRGAAINFSVRGGDAHFAEQLLRRQSKKSLRARVLQGRQTEASGFEGTLKAAGQPGAHGAVSVEENPTAGGPASFCISYF